MQRVAATNGIDRHMNKAPRVTREPNNFLSTTKGKSTTITLRGDVLWGGVLKFRCDVAAVGFKLRVVFSVLDGGLVDSSLFLSLLSLYCEVLNAATFPYVIWYRRPLCRVPRWCVILPQTSTSNADTIRPAYLNTARLEQNFSPWHQQVFGTEIHIYIKRSSLTQTHFLVPSQFDFKERRKKMLQGDMNIWEAQGGIRHSRGGGGSAGLGWERGACPCFPSPFGYVAPPLEQGRVRLG